MSQINPDGLDYADVVTYGYASDRWNFVEGEALIGIIAKLNKEQSRYVLSATQSRVVWRTLIFYPGATLVRVTDLSWRPSPKTFYFIGLRGQYRRMDGTRAFIEFLNQNIPLRLTEQVVVEYLRFYCFFLRYNSRPFLLVEQEEDLGSFPVELSSAHKSAIKPLLHPACVTPIGEGQTKSFEIKAITRFSDSLFECRYHIDSDGSVSLIQEEELPIDLPDYKNTLAIPAWNE